MTGSRLSPDAERELRDLRIRAYGPNPDIGSDPAALARLAELEAAHASARPSVMDIAPPVAAVESLAVTAPATTTIDTRLGHSSRQPSCATTAWARRSRGSCP